MTREDIFASVRQYHKDQPTKEFIPGVTPINYAGRVYDSEELVAGVDSVLDFYLTGGKYTEKFEYQFAKAVGAKHCFLVNSGSSANLLAMTALGLKKGDEVLTVAAGFPTTVNPIIQNGLVPVFIDIGLETLNIDITKLVVTRKTKAVMLAHTLGNPFNLNYINALCKEYNLKLICDCCDALGSTYNEKPMGIFGDITTYSFYPAHHITGGEGGAVCTNNDTLAKTIKSYRDWGRECFPAGTMIDTDKGAKTIESVEIGDNVLTHTGNYMPVKKVFKTKHDDILHAIKCQKKKVIECTPSHKLYVVRKSKENPEWIEAKDVCVGDYLTEKVPEDFSSIEEIVWDYETFYINKTEKLAVSEDLMRLCGYWLAEGSLAKGDKFSNGAGEKGRMRHRIYYKYRVEFAFNINEVEYINDVINLMHTFFGITNVFRNRRKESNGISLSFNTRKGYEFFHQLFGEISYNKRLPDFFLFLENKYLVALLKGFWRGDGSYWGGSSKQEGVQPRRACYNIGTTSPVLHEQIRKILLKLSINPSVGIRTPEQHSSSVVNGKEIIARRNMYLTSLYGENAKRFADLLGESTDNISAANIRLFTDDGKYALFPVTEVSFSEEIVDYVYNLHVERDNSYHANGIVAHNCVCAPGQSGVCGHRFSRQYGTLPFGYDHKYVYSNIGYNLKSTEMTAAILTAQLEKLPHFVHTRKINYHHYNGFLKEELGLGRYFEWHHPENGSDPAWFAYPLTVREGAPFTRNELTEHLAKKKIETRNLFGGNLTRQPAYRGINYMIIGGLKNTNKVMNDTFFLGTYPGMTQEMILYTAKTIADFIEGKK